MFSKKIYFLKIFSFVLIFGALATYLIATYGPFRGLHSTLLVWSFYVLCVPISGDGRISARLVSFFTRRTIQHPRLLTWALAILINLFSYTLIPTSYLRLATTFLLLSILSTPWPLWLIIGISALVSGYNSLAHQITQQWFLPIHLFIKTALAATGIILLGYLSYVELIIFLSAKTC